MALSRCKELHPNPKGRTENYRLGVEPIGFPNTSSICGRHDCENPGLIWLTKKEKIDYENGKRIFSFPSAVSKVRVL